MTAVTTQRCFDLGSLVREHQADLWRYLRFLGAESSEAEDLVQETFVAVFRRRPEIRSPAETAAYLRRVARNQLLAARRKASSTPSLVDLEAAESVWAEMTHGGPLDDYLEALSGCLETAVDPRKRHAVELRYRDGASRDKIAAELDLTVDGVKTLLRRARTALRNCVERKLSGD